MKDFASRTQTCCLACVLACLSGLALPALAANISVAGTMEGRALLVVDGVSRIYAVGQTVTGGVLLLQVENAGVVLEVQGRKQRVAIGQRLPGAMPGQETAVLRANAQGHHIAMGSINDISVRFLVDTGATMVSLGRSDARRLRLAAGGQKTMVQTANGTVEVTRARLDRVTVGDITLESVDAFIQDTDMPVVLLGMSFLGRTEMRFEGQELRLKKRY